MGTADECGCTQMKRLYPRSSAFISGFNFSLSGEGGTAPARARRVRVLEHEAATHYLVLEVDLDPVEVQVALHVAQDLHAVRFQDFVALGRLVFDEIQRVAEPRAPAAADADAQRR